MTRAESTGLPTRERHRSAGRLPSGVVVVSDKGTAYLVVATRYELNDLRRQM